MTRDQTKEALKILTSEERIEHYLALRLDPGIHSVVGYVQGKIACLRALLTSKKLGGIIDEIASLEKNNLSWSKTVGPACVAIIRLG